MKRDKYNDVVWWMWMIFLICTIMFGYYATAQTPREIYEECKLQNVKYPKIVTAQSIQETGWYKSYNCTKRNNLFGLRYNHKYKVFNHWKESVTYYRDHIQNRYKNGENYYDFLDRIGYASDSLYNQKIRSIVRKYSINWE